MCRKWAGVKVGRKPSDWDRGCLGHGWRSVLILSLWLLKFLYNRHVPLWQSKTWEIFNIWRQRVWRKDHWTQTVSNLSLTLGSACHEEGPRESCLRLSIRGKAACQTAVLRVKWDVAPWRIRWGCPTVVTELKSWLWDKRSQDDETRLGMQAFAVTV